MTTVTREGDDEDAEGDVAVLLDPLHAPRTGAVRGPLTQLRTSPALERGLLLERQLELVGGLSHPHGVFPMKLCWASVPRGPEGMAAAGV